MYSKQVDEVRGKPCLPAALVHKPPRFPSRKASPGGLQETSPLQNGSPTMLMTPRCQGKEEQKRTSEGSLRLGTELSAVDTLCTRDRAAFLQLLLTDGSSQSPVRPLTNQPPGRSLWAPPEEVGLGGSCSGHLRAGGPEKGAIPLCRPEGFTCGWSTENGAMVHEQGWDYNTALNGKSDEESRGQCSFNDFTVGVTRHWVPASHSCGFSWGQARLSDAPRHPIGGTQCISCQRLGAGGSHAMDSPSELLPGNQSSVWGKDLRTEVLRAPCTERHLRNLRKSLAPGPSGNADGSSAHGPSSSKALIRVCQHCMLAPGARTSPDCSPPLPPTQGPAETLAENTQTHRNRDLILRYQHKGKQAFSVDRNHVSAMLGPGLDDQSCIGRYVAESVAVLTVFCHGLGRRYLCPALSSGEKEIGSAKGFSHVFPDPLSSVTSVFGTDIPTRTPFPASFPVASSSSLSKTHNKGSLPSGVISTLSVVNKIPMCLDSLQR
ncbi:hypothetical protein MJG53_018475 [Ovis ammon polii x Ovis aries]|uniref:Uncharacterized protein n=1 Tax=Ovis ammon polii x Ovis aries TaxID=2918886 RepID=A0ACB9U3I2_9CETA|nr:hypothetical protein MJG53_018475 [Ovis ammon polii x Ovis aries]